VQLGAKAMRLGARKLQLAAIAGPARRAQPAGRAHVMSHHWAMVPGQRAAKRLHLHSSPGTVTK
jgi:hypothetical protein